MRGRAWYVVGLLAVLYIVSYIDRLILTLLVEPIKADIALTDTQMGLLIGPAFAVFYSIIGMPVAWLVDRGNRKRLLIAGVLLWTLSTLFAGYATSFWTLFALRMGLALGESVLSPVALSLIGDIFPPGRRAAPSAAFISAGTLGVMLAYVTGGAIIDLAHSGWLVAVPGLGGLPTWRLALVLVSVPGFLIALIVLFTVREPMRGGQGYPPSQYSPDHRPHGIFASRRQATTFYSSLFIGNAILGMMLYGALSWYPTHLIRTQGVTASEAGYIFSTALAGAVVLALVIPTLSEYWQKRGRKDLLLLFPLFLIPLGTAMFLLALKQSSLLHASVLMAAGFSLLSGINGLPSITVPLTAPPPIRARLVALVQFCNNIGGLSVGSFAIAWLSDHVFHGTDGLGRALFAVGMGTAPVAWVLFVIAWRIYRRALHRPDSIETT